MMNIQVLFFAHYQDAAGESMATISVPDGATVRTLVEGLRRDYPGLGDVLAHGRIAVNEEFATADHILSEGDEVALMPPMSGGKQ